MQNNRKNEISQVVPFNYVGFNCHASIWIKLCLYEKVSFYQPYLIQILMYCYNILGLLLYHSSGKFAHEK